MARRIVVWLGAALGFMAALSCLDWLGGAIRGLAGYTPDPDFGMVAQNLTITYRSEGNGVSHWLEHGIRWNGRPTVEGPRVAVLGDSITQALQVDDSQTFVSQAEERLRQGGWPINLVNMGRSSLSLADYIQMAPAVARVVKPDWVVIEVQDPDFESDAWEPGKRHFAYAAGHQLKVVEAESAPPTSPDAIGRLSNGLYALKMPGLAAMIGLRNIELRKRFAQEPPWLMGGYPVTRQPPLTYPVEAELDQLCQAYGGRLTLLYLNYFQAARPGKSTALQEKIVQLCQRAGVSYLNVAEQDHEFLRLGLAPRGFPNTKYNAGHLNAVGHQVIGAALAQELLKLHQRGIF